MNLLKAAFVASIIGLASTANLCTSEQPYVESVPIVNDELYRIIEEKLPDDKSKTDLDVFIQLVRLSKTVELANMDEKGLQSIINELPRFQKKYFTDAQLTDLK